MRVRRLIVPVLVGRPPFFMPYHKMGIGVLKSHNCSLNAAQILPFALNFRAITNDLTRWWNALLLGMRYGFLALTPRPLPCCVSEMRRNNSLPADFPRVTAYFEAELSRSRLRGDHPFDLTEARFWIVSYYCGKPTVQQAGEALLSRGKLGVTNLR